MVQIWPWERRRRVALPSSGRSGPPPDRGDSAVSPEDVLIARRPAVPCVTLWKATAAAKLAHCIKAAAAASQSGTMPRRWPRTAARRTPAASDMPPPPPPGRAAGARAARAAALWPLLFLLLRPCSAAAQRPEEPAQDEGNAADSWFGPELGLMYKVISECSRQPDLWLCLKLKALWTLERARAARGPLPLTGYLSLAPDPEEESSSTAVEPPPDTEAQLEEQLPRDLGQRQDRVDALLVQSADRLLRSRALQITLPASVFEGRGKKKDKYGGMMLAAGAAMAGMFLQVAMGKIALLAGKALLVAKIALVLSTVIGLKKLVGGGGGGGDHQVVYAGDGHGGGGGGWGRRNLDEEAHLMAYSAQQPQGRAAARGQREGGPVGAGVEEGVVSEAGAGMTGDVEGDQSLNNRLR